MKEIVLNIVVVAVLVIALCLLYTIKILFKRWMFKQDLRIHRLGIYLLSESQHLFKGMILEAFSLGA